jgi:O-antigen/teichoic acid export membrane protein
MNVDLSRRNIIHNLLALFSGTAFSQLAVALSVFLTARALGSDSFGVYAASFALTRITALIFNLGLDNWMLREGGSHPQDAGKLMGSILKIKFAGGLGWLALLAPFLSTPANTL